MDKYTENIKAWLDKRFTRTDRSGVYLAHQPIYGFRRGPTEPGATSRYIITYQIMKALAHLQFKTFLDIGGAEGYKAALVRSIYDAEVRSCDLSQEACNRAKEIFNIDGESVDICHLPYKDNQFDVVLCSETLEHVPDFKNATSELLRVCSKAVLITVPHEPERVIQRNIAQNVPHGHIHSLDTNSFDFAIPPATKIIPKKILSSLLKIPCALVDGIERGEVKGYPDCLVKLNNLFAPLFRTIFGQGTASLMVSTDDILSRLIPLHSGVLLVLVKDENCYSINSTKHITPAQIIDFQVPYYHLSNDDAAN